MPFALTISTAHPTMNGTPSEFRCSHCRQRCHVARISQVDDAIREAATTHQCANGRQRYIFAKMIRDKRLQARSVVEFVFSRVVSTRAKNDRKQRVASADNSTIYGSAAYSNDIKEFMCDLVDVLQQRGLTIQESLDLFELAKKTRAALDISRLEAKTQSSGQNRTPEKKVAVRLLCDDERMFLKISAAAGR